MTDEKLRIAIIGCGHLGQQYATVYQAFPDTEIVAIAEYDPDKRKVVGQRFGVTALYPDAESMLRQIVPDIAAVVTPTKFMKQAVIACAEAGVKGVTTDKPLAATLADADAMVEVCQSKGIVFGGGNLQRAMYEVQEAALWLREGRYGDLIGACIHRYNGEISGGGCQHISILRLFGNAEIEQVMAWGTPQEALDSDTDTGLAINGIFRLTNGLECQIFGPEMPHSGVEVWTEDALIRWNWNPPEIFQGFDKNGHRIKSNVGYTPNEWPQFYYLGSSIRSFLTAVRTGSELYVSGHDLRQALEAAIAAKLSAQMGNVAVKLPLEDRSLTLYPSPARWGGHPQSLEDAAKPWPGWPRITPSGH
jgi:predicted dehydrogenase